MARSTQQTTEHLARTADNLPGPALSCKEPSPPPLILPALLQYGSVE